MILNSGCDPKINVVFIGAEILKILIEKPTDLDVLIPKIAKLIDVSFDHVLLAIDWLFVINAITKDGNNLVINETK
jgi:hypothetical protein